MGLAAVLIWATSASCALWIGRQVGVWQYLALGNLVGGVGQIVLYRMMGQEVRSLFILPWRLWAVAVLGFVIYSACYATGLISATSDTQAVGVGLMNHLWPVLTVVFAVFLVPGTRMSARLGLALALSFLGLIVASGHEIVQARLSGSSLPYVLGGLAGICWGLYSALIARWRDWCHDYVTAPVGFLMVSAASIVICSVKGEWQPVDMRTWLAILFLGLGPNAAGYMLWEKALHRAPATTLGLLASATPLLSTLCLLGLFAVTGQSHSLPPRWGSLLLGAVLITAAVLLSSVKFGRTTNEGKETEPHVEPHGS